MSESVSEQFRQNEKQKKEEEKRAFEAKILPSVQTIQKALGQFVSGLDARLSEAATAKQSQLNVHVDAPLEGGDVLRCDSEYGKNFYETMLPAIRKRIISVPEYADLWNHCAQLDLELATFIINTGKTINKIVGQREVCHGAGDGGTHCNSVDVYGTFLTSYSISITIGPKKKSTPKAQ